MDFISYLSPSSFFDIVYVMVDRLTNVVHFVPCKKTINSKETMKLFLDNVYRYEGLLDDIVSDQGPQVTSKFLKFLFEILKIDIKLSSAFQLQTDR